MDIGAIVLVFGLFITGRGLYDVLRPGSVADYNRGRNQRIRTGTLNQPVPMSELRNPRPEKVWRVRSQGRNVLYTGLATIAAGIVIMILF